MTKILLIALGGAAGSVFRYLLAGWGQRLAPESFPFGTLLVNVIGCLLIGFLYAAFAGPWLVREEYRIALMVGLLGGFTTFSTFGYETFALANDGQWGLAAFNIGLSVTLCLAAVGLGYRLAQRMLGA